MTEQTSGDLLASFEKNATEVVRISRTTFKGHELVDCRVYFENDSGGWQASKKGLCQRPETFARFAGAVVDVCRQLGLTPGSEEGSLSTSGYSVSSPEGH